MAGSGSTLILASDPDPDPLRFLFPDPDPAKCSGSGWIRVEPKLCREKRKTKCFLSVSVCFQSSGSAREKKRESILVALNTIKANKKELRKLKDPISSYPIAIKEVARLLQAMPPTQVSVERLFSALKLQKSDLRNRIKADALDALLLLKANSDHIDKLA